MSRMALDPVAIQDGLAAANSQYPAFHLSHPLPDHVPVPTFGPRMVCTSCGIIGADARPNWREQPPRETLFGVQWR
jgi:hypothetical protein